MSSNRIEEIARVIVDCGFRVHRELGPGLLESAYEACLVHAIGRAGLGVRRQVELPVTFEGLRVEVGYRLDLLVEELVIVEIKAIEKVLPVHKAQLLSYLRLASKPLGLLINFHSTLFKDGVSRIANDYHAGPA